MKISTLIILAGSFLITGIAHSQTSNKTKKMAEKEHYTKALVDYNDFKNLVSELEKQREERLVSLDIFL